MLALAVCTAIVLVIGGPAFWLGLTWARQGEVEDVVLTFRPRHPSCQPANLRLVQGGRLFDQDANPINPPGRQ